MLAATRQFFAERDILEVETPALNTAGVTDPNISSIRVDTQALARQPLFLHTSPEYCMKRLLAAGSPDIYQVGKVFRDGELGDRHQLEFTMIEWYRRGFDLPGIAAETCALIQALAAAVDHPHETVLTMSYSDAFSATTGMNPLQADAGSLIAWVGEHIPGTSGLAATLGKDQSAWLDLIMSHAVVPSLPRDRLVIVTHYPASQAALARLSPGEPNVAERFEIFRNGAELANGYHELGDPEELRQRFEQDRDRRKLAGLPDMAADQNLLAAMQAGLPDCAGVAVGFDRVVMSYLGLTRIRDAVSFAL